MGKGEIRSRGGIYMGYYFKYRNDEKTHIRELDKKGNKAASSNKSIPTRGEIV